MQRRLAAVLAADIVSYSRLMGADEALTLERLKALLSELVRPTVKKFSGRIVKLMGDGLLAEFSSAVDAVHCAVEIQNSLNVREADEPEVSRLRFRMGINLGDIMVEGGDIFGDGVNIAARLESIAEPGGICISAKVHEEVAVRVGYGFEDLGQHEMKNIVRPVQVWGWIPEGQPSGRLTPPASQPGLPDKPSIAVLPFDNMSSDPDQDFFADGMAEDIITALSRMPWFFVIARNSSFTYKGSAVDVKQVSSDLGVRYVLEGSVRKSGNRLRITAQLIDATNGQHVWAEKYDRDVVDIFDVQDEVTEAIVAAVAPEFVSSEVKKAKRKDPSNLDAWECVMRGRAHVWKLGREDAEEARKLFERAIELAPSGEFGTSDLALVHGLQTYYRWSSSPLDSSAKMVAYADQAVAVDDNDPLALTILAWANVFARKWDECLPPVERAIAISPNFAPAIGIRGTVLALLGESETSIEIINDAIRLSPRDGFMGIWLMGTFWAYHSLSRYEEAANTAKSAIRIAPDNPTFRRQYASALANLGKIEEARTAVQDYLRLSPGHTIADAAKVPSKSHEQLERFLKGLRLAGMPESEQ